MSVSSLYLKTMKFGKEVFNIINVNYKVEEEKEVKTIESIHHIHVIDRSYSMNSDINKLIDNVQSTLDFIGSNDLVSVIWFSSESQCKVLFKGTNATSKDVIIKKLDTIRSCVGCTCFSEPLKLVDEVIEDLKDICPNFNICFFTDGETVTGWSKQEEDERINNILSDMNSKHQLLALNTIGYGNYYDEELLNKMSSYSAFGTFYHSNQITDYSKIFTHEYEKIKDNVLQTCDINMDNSDILYLTPKNSNLFNNTFHTNTINKIKNQFFIITKDEEFKINDEVYNIKDIRTTISRPSLMNFLYTYSKELYKRGNQHKALDVLIHTQDKYAIDTVMTSFTRDEKAKAVEYLASCYISNKNRNQNGKVGLDYIPDDNAYNVITFLSELANANAIYYPTENYNRIGKATTLNTSSFIKTDDVIKSKMDELVFNEKKLNVSIRYKINGIVSLDKQLSEAVNLLQEQKCHMYRMQTIIKDGILNVPEIKISVNIHYLSADAKKVISKYVVHKEDGIYTCIIDLKSLPITNRHTSNLTTSDILSLTKHLLEMKAQQKALKVIEKDLDVKLENKDLKPFIPFINEPKVYTQEQLALLSQYGLDGKGNYIGLKSETDKESTSSDYYEAKSIEFSIKGCSSIPKVSDSLSKKEKGKKLNLMDEAIVSCMESYKASSPILVSDLIRRNKEQITNLSALLFAAKISKVLTGGWWEGLTVTPKHEEYEENGIVLQIKTKYDKVYL